MKFISTIMTTVLMIAALSALSSCGKISDPTPIEGSGYPHIYPRR